MLSSRFGGAPYKGGRFVILLAVLFLADAPARCQSLWDSDLYSATFGFHGAWPSDNRPTFSASRVPPIEGTISADVLRNPLSTKARRALEKATHQSELGNHAAAIEYLHEALVRYPRSAPYALTLLGAELVEVHQYAEAADAFEQVARTMPHVSATHSNFGLSLALTGKIDAAERELRQAITLDHGNRAARHILEVVLLSRRRVPRQAAAVRTPLP